MALTSIEWATMVWNFLRGCKPISSGCAKCYAQRFAERWRGTPGHPYEQGFDLRLVPEKLIEPFKWPKRHYVFVNSVSDVFYEDVPDDFIKQAFNIMKATPWHVYQILTKRAERMQQWVSKYEPDLADHPHIWLGVSVENQKQGVPRIAHLRDTPAKVRFLSVEPLLEPLGKIVLDDMDWVIVGGESGPKCRPMAPDWVRSIRDQSQDAGVDFFFKQHGGVNKKKAGRILDGRTHDARPLMPNVTMPNRLCRNLKREDWEHQLKKAGVLI